MKLHNYEIQPLMEFILKPGLKGKKNYLRMRFYELLSSQLEQVRKDQQILLKDFKAVDGDGRIIFKEDGQTPDVDDLNAYQKDFNELLNEEFHVEENESNKEMLFAVRDLILDFDEELFGNDAINHYTFCKMFDDLNYNEE